MYSRKKNQYQQFINKCDAEVSDYIISLEQKNAMLTATNYCYSKCIEQQKQTILALADQIAREINTKNTK